MVLFFSICAVRVLSHNDLVQGLPVARVASERVKRLMQYHGIGFATIDDTGAWFMRNEERCRLK